MAIATRKLRLRRGMATVEMAVVGSLLVVLTLGLIEYGWIFLKAQQVTNAARQGARTAIRADVYDYEVFAAVEDVMQKANMPEDQVHYTRTITVRDYEDGTVKAWADAQSGDLIEVRVSVPTANIAIMRSPWMPLPTNLSAAVSMAKEGPPQGQ